MRTSARSAAILFAVLLLSVLGGCSTSPVEAIRRRDVNATYQPAPGSAEFRRLTLEKTRSIVVLKIGGDDVGSNMAEVSQALLRKGYSVRDYHITLQDLTKADLLARKPLDPEVLEKAAKLFKEDVAVAGSLEVLQMEPLRARLSLTWLNLKTRKVLWTTMATFSGYIFGGAGRYEGALRDMIERALEPIPPAAP